MEKLPLTDSEAVKIAETAIENFRGDARILTSAIGTLFLGRRVGYRPLLLMCDKTTIKRYEAALNVEFRDLFPEEGDLSHKSVAWKAARGVSNFWKAVKGEIPGIRSTDIK